MKSNTTEATNLIAAVKAAMAFTTADLSPKLDAAGVTHPEQRQANIMQNVLRTCLEVCLQEAAPYSEELPVDIAFRLASYCVSSLPLNVQPHAIGFIRANLAEIHTDRVRKGIIIKTTWASLHEGTETKQ